MSNSASDSASMAGNKEDCEVGKGASQVVMSENGPYIDPVQEAKVLRKMDMYLIPLLGFIYLICFLDRANIGSAKVAGMSKDLGLTNAQYSTAVSILYVTYITFECVWPILIKVLTAKVVMAGAILGFGACTIGTAFSGSYEGLVACRLVLGFTEAGVFPCIVVYMSMTYRRSELGVRSAYIFVCAAMSGGFGGLIAYGLSHIKSGSLESWQWIYIVEGILSIAAAPAVYFYIPDRVDRSWFLKEDERALCTKRYESMKRDYSPNEKFEWASLRAALMSWTTYAHGSLQFGVDVTLYGISTFMPVFIRDFGYGTIVSQILTVPVYAVGAASFVIQSRISDKKKLRGPFIAANLAVQLIGYIVLASVSGPAGVRYFALYIVSIGMYLPVGLNVSWTQNNNGPHYKRALSVGVMQLMGNSSGVAIGYIYNDGPRYVRGFGIAAGLVFFSICMTIVLTVYYRSQNRKKQAAIDAGAQDDASLGDRNPHFLYYM